MLSSPGITWTSPYPNPIIFLPPLLISMSTFDLNLASASPIEEEDTSNHADSCLSSSNLFTNLHQQIPNHCMTYPLHQFQQQQPKEFLFTAGSSDHPIPHRYVPTEKEDERASKWMPSKMRFMRKMMNSTHIVVSKARVSSVPVAEDQQLQAANGGFNPSNNSPPSGVIRVCSDCNTTKTPLWRSGPRGPKSLCNACGIRQRKARRAMAAAMNGGVLIPSHAPVKVRKEKKFDTDRTLPFKKRCKMNFTSNATPAKKVCYDDVAMSSNKNVQKVFPQEERDAAILLMDLSCGIINSQLSAC